MWDALRAPIPQEKKDLLADRWSSLEPALRTDFQGFGQQSTGCGAVLGAFPRCDFDCRGCYLGADANAVKPFDRQEIFRQLDALRRHLGPKGNVQITDGEVTLLPIKVLLAILRYARDIGLIPMLMTHGDSFRRKPDLLTRLVAEGGLTEVSIHVDTTQQGRRGEWNPQRESDLHPLRDEFAALIRRVRRETGVRLRAATTMTVTSENLDGVESVVSWCLENRDAFGLISFQPLAPVGRTREELVGVKVAELWERVGAALAEHGVDTSVRTPAWFGHPDCTRMETLLVLDRPGRSPVAAPMLRPGEERDRAIAERYLELGFGGVVFRDDSLSVRLARGAGMFLRAPGWFFGPFRRWMAARTREFGTTLPRLVFQLLRGRARLDGFSVASHHFMGAEEMATAKGQERLEACVFRLPVEDRMVPMCQINAGDLRDRLYDRGWAVGKVATAEERPRLPVVDAVREPASASL